MYIRSKCDIYKTYDTSYRHRPRSVTPAPAVPAGLSREQLREIVATMVG